MVITIIPSFKEAAADTATQVERLAAQMVSRRDRQDFAGATDCLAQMARLCGIPEALADDVDELASPPLLPLFRF